MALRMAGEGLTLVPPSFSGVGSPGIAAAAVSTGSIPEAFQALRKESPDYKGLGEAMVGNRAGEEVANLKAELGVKGAGIGAVGNTHNAKLVADAKLSIAEAQIKAAEKAAKEATKNWGLQTAAKAAFKLAFLSDERTKHSIEELDSVAMMLRNLRPVSYFYKQEYTNDPWRKHYGFIAQEYRDVMPEATHEDKATGLYTIDTSELIALLVKGYQELDNRITRIEAKNVLVGVS